MKALWYVLLVLASLSSYLLFALVLGIDQRVPWPQILVAGVGLGLLVRGLMRQFSWSGLIGSTVSAAMIAFFSWWVFVFSEYPPNDARPAAGQTLDLAATTLPNQDGKAVALAPLLAKPGPLLLVFYRGHW